MNDEQKTDKGTAPTSNPKVTTVDKIAEVSDKITGSVFDRALKQFKVDNTGRIDDGDLPVQRETIVHSLLNDKARQLFKRSAAAAVATGRLPELPSEELIAKMIPTPPDISGMSTSERDQYLKTVTRAFMYASNVSSILTKFDKGEVVSFDEYEKLILISGEHGYLNGIMFIYRKALEYVTIL